jgi:hypothetical protein
MHGGEGVAEEDELAVGVGGGDGGVGREGLGGGRGGATNAKAIVAVSIPRRWLGRSCTENKSGKSLVSLQGSLVLQAKEREGAVSSLKTTVT